MIAPFESDRQVARTLATAQAFHVLLAYAEASEPRALIALGALLSGAAFVTTNSAAADVLRLAAARLERAAGGETP